MNARQRRWSSPSLLSGGEYAIQSWKAPPVTPRSPIICRKFTWRAGVGQQCPHLFLVDDHRGAVLGAQDVAVGRGPGQGPHGIGGEVGQVQIFCHGHDSTRP